MRASDVVIGVHYEDQASQSANQTFQRMKEELKGVGRQAKTLRESSDQSSAALKKLSTVLGGLVTIGMVRRLALFTVEVTKLSTEGAKSVDRAASSFANLKKTLGETFAVPLSGFFQEASKVLDGFSVQLEAFNVLYHKIFGGYAATPTIDRLAGIKPVAIDGPKAELARQIRQAKLDASFEELGQQVQQEEDQRRAKAKQDAAAREQHRQDLVNKGNPFEVFGVDSNYRSAAYRAKVQGEKQKAELDKLFYLTGQSNAQQQALGYKQGLQVNLYDFEDLSQQTAVQAANSFRDKMMGVLSQSYKDLLTGDPEQAFKDLGVGTLDSVVTGFTDKLADATLKSSFGMKLQAFVGDGTTAAVKGIGDVVSNALDTGLDMTKLRAIGSRAGGNLKEGVDKGFDWLFPDVSSSWGPQGATFNAIKGGVSAALKGGVEGAAIGTLIATALGSSELTTKYTQIGASIGGAIGGAIGGPGGAGIGSLIGSLAGQVWQTGASKQQEGDYKNLLIDVAAFGGATGFFSRIGGLKGFTGNRQRALAGGGAQDFATLLRVTQGVTEEQANWFTQFLAQGSLELGASEEAQVLNVMRNLGFSQADIDLAAKGITPPPTPGARNPAPGGVDANGMRIVGTGEPIISPTTGGRTTQQEEFDLQTAAAPKLVVAPPPPTRPTSLLSPVEQAQALLRNAQSSHTLSRSAMQTLGWTGVVSQAINDVGGFWPVLGTQIKAVIQQRETPGDLSYLRSYGIDIAAARGFLGTVNRPTRFLAGEAGPEDVMVIPQGMRSGITGGGITGNGQPVLNLTINIATPNVESMRAYVERELWPMTKEIMWRESNSGTPLIRQRAVVS